MIMKATFSGLLALAIIAGAASQVAAATADDGCTMNWTKGSWSGRSLNANRGVDLRSGAQRAATRKPSSSCDISRTDI